MLAGNSQFSPRTFYSLFLFSLLLLWSGTSENKRGSLFGKILPYCWHLWKWIYFCQHSQLSTFITQTYFQYHSLTWKKVFASEYSQSHCMSNQKVLKHITATCQSLSDPWWLSSLLSVNRKTCQTTTRAKLHRNSQSGHRNQRAPKFTQHWKYFSMKL